MPPDTSDVANWSVAISCSLILLFLIIYHGIKFNFERKTNSMKRWTTHTHFLVFLHLFLGFASGIYGVSLTLYIYEKDHSKISLDDCLFISHRTIIQALTYHWSKGKHCCAPLPNKQKIWTSAVAPPLFRTLH